MGMDVYGKEPTEEVGKYFRNSAWSWRPLWRYVCQIAPWVSEVVVYGQSNDGDGLNAKGSKKLAKALLEEVSSGRTKEVADAYTAGLKAKPDEDCRWCKGTGNRAKARGDFTEKDMEWVNGCNGCRGTGKVRPDACLYPFSEENVKEFAEFVGASGGFEIH